MMFRCLCCCSTSSLRRSKFDRRKLGHIKRFSDHKYVYMKMQDLPL